VHIYWASRESTAITADPAVPTLTATWDNGNITERLDYLALYSEMRLDWLRFKYIPCNLTVLGGPTTAVTGVAGVASTVMIDTTRAEGPDNASIV